MAMACKHAVAITIWEPEGTVFSIRCSSTFGCGAQLPIGHANDRATTALHREPREDLEGAFDWDPARPLAEQWPWNGAGSPQREHEDLLGDVEVQMATGAEPEQGVEVTVEIGPDAEPDDETPDISAGYDGQGTCESCGKPIFNGEDVHVWEDHIVSHVDCPIDLDDVPAQPDAYVPGGSVCIADDVTECECAKCAAADEQWERDQGWHGDDGGDNDPDDCDPAALEDDDAISDVDTADAIAAQEQRFAGGSRFVIVSCIKGEPTTPRRVAGVSSWDTRQAADLALNGIAEEPDHPDPDDFTVQEIDAQALASLLAGVREAHR